MASINYQALTGRLKSQIDPRYLIYGNESFLVERCVEAIRARARDEGHQERTSLIVERDFDWTLLGQHLSAMSLFAEKKLIEIRLLSGKPGKVGGEALVECMASVDASIIVVLVLGSVDRSSRESKWFKTWDHNSVSVDNPVLLPSQFKDWIGNALRRRNIQFEPEVVTRLAYLFEGNMLAVANEISKLSMGNDGTILTVAEVDRIVNDQGQFNVYALADTCMAGRADRAVRLLHVLRNEGQQPILILWLLAREIRIVSKCASIQTTGVPLRRAFTSLGVWKSKQTVVERAVRRLGLAGSELILARIAKADRIMKGLETADGGEIWDELERISLLICGVKQLRAR